jgi:hypothetical protein
VASANKEIFDSPRAKSMDESFQLKNFLELPYSKLEELNLTARKKKKYPRTKRA